MLGKSSYPSFHRITVHLLQRPISCIVPPFASPMHKRLAQSAAGICSALAIYIRKILYKYNMILYIIYIYIMYYVMCSVPILCVVDIRGNLGREMRGRWRLQVVSNYRSCIAARSNSLLYISTNGTDFWNCGIKFRLFQNDVSFIFVFRFYGPFRCELGFKVGLWYVLHIVSLLRCWWFWVNYIFYSSFYMALRNTWSWNSSTTWFALPQCDLLRCRNCGWIWYHFDHLFLYEDWRWHMFLRKEVVQVPVGQKTRRCEHHSRLSSGMSKRGWLCRLYHREWYLLAGNQQLVFWWRCGNSSWTRAEIHLCQSGLWPTNRMCRFGRL